MKKNLLYIIPLFIAVLFSACKKDEEVQIASLSLENFEISVSYKSAEIKVDIYSDATLSEVLFQYTTDSTFKEFLEKRMPKVAKTEHRYEEPLEALSDGTKYYFRCKALNKVSSCTSKQYTFTTKQIDAPTIGSISINDISYTTAVCVVKGISSGGGTITDRGICYSKKTNPTISDFIVQSGSGVGSFTSNLTGLTPGTTYYVRAYATNEKGTNYSEQTSFTTTAYGKPAVTTAVPITNITYTSATCGGNVTADGGQTVTARGVCYSTTQNPTISNSKVQNGSGIGSFTCKLTGLSAGTFYYVRAYATNSKGTSYGQQIYFKTIAYDMPTVTTSAVTNITYSSVTCGGNITADGGQTVTARGICYSTTQNPTISNNKVTSGSGIGSFTCNLTGLSDGTTYYVRAYATNSKGTSYGQQISFKTTAYGMPTVSTSDATDITYTTAICGGYVTADGGKTITARGICYSTTQNPTISNNKVTSGSGIGSFTCNLTGLSVGTTYYVRAYATNSNGTSYGQQVSFSTIEGLLPTIITNSVTSITHNSAICSGSVTSDGGLTVTEKGICYSLDASPTIYMNKVVSGNGVGTYSCTLSSLISNATYHVRAYATNSEGTVYGDEIIFTTLLQSGALNGIFSVSYSKKIVFSKGNLQYKASTHSWQFAENQWDYIGADNANISNTYDGWIDLFGWGTGNQPTQNSSYSDNYQYYNEWGNKISGAWRTLNASEWQYLLENRKNANQLCGKATINGKHSFVLLPDNWSAPQNINFQPNALDWATNTYTISQWENMENNGAVCIVMAGLRYGTLMNLPNFYEITIGVFEGFYWSATIDTDSDNAAAVCFQEDTAISMPIIKWTIRCIGGSVRLVADVN